MGNSHVSLSISEASSKFTPSELTELGRTFRSLLHSTASGRLQYPTFEKRCRRWYTPQLLLPLFNSVATDHHGAGGPASSTGPATSQSMPAIKASPTAQTLDYDAFMTLICMVCKCEIDATVQLLLNSFASPVEQSRFSKLTLHSVLTVLAESAAHVLGLDLLSDYPKDLPTKEETAALVGVLVTAAFANTVHPTLNFKETTDFFSKHSQFIHYLRYGFSHLYHVFDKALSPDEAAKGLPLPPELVRRLIPIPPKLLGVKSDTSILNDAKLAAQIVSWLPPKYRHTSLVQLFSTQSHGFSLSTLLFTFERKHKALERDPCILLVEDSDNNVFGAFIPVPLQKHSSGKFYGDRTTFVFKLQPPPAVAYPASGRDQNYIFTSRDGSLGFGGQVDFHGFFLDTDFRHGYFRRCETYRNAEVSGASSFRFQVKSVECWGLIKNTRLEFFTNEPVDDDDGLDPDRTDVSKSSILNKASSSDRFILEMLGGTGPTRDQHG